MSSHSKSSLHGTGVHEPNFAIAMRISSVMAEANEHLIKVQANATNEAFAENSKYIKALLSAPNTGDYGAMLAGWSNLYQANMRIALEVSRSCLEIVPQTQAEIAKALGAPFAVAH